MGSCDDEFCSDAVCEDKSCIGGSADDAGSPSVCKVRLIVSSMMAPGADVGVVGNPSND